MTHFKIANTIYVTHNFNVSMGYTLMTHKGAIDYENWLHQMFND